MKLLMNPPPSLAKLATLLLPSAPAMAQTTGTITAGFATPAPVSVSATLNASREWVLSYSANAQAFIDSVARDGIIGVNLMMRPRPT